MSRTSSWRQTPKLRTEINASLEAVIAEADRVRYVNSEEADRRAEELLARLAADAADGKTVSEPGS